MGPAELTEGELAGVNNFFRLIDCGFSPAGYLAGETSSLITRNFDETPSGQNWSTAPHRRRRGLRPRQDAADLRMIVTGVEGVPPAGQIGLEPAGKIDRLRIGRNADIAHVTGAIARRNAHAAAKHQR